MMVEERQNVLGSKSLTQRSNRLIVLGAKHLHLKSNFGQGKKHIRFIKVTFAWSYSGHSKNYTFHKNARSGGSGDGMWSQWLCCGSRGNEHIPGDRMGGVMAGTKK